jgi:glycerate 2-kinase
VTPARAEEPRRIARDLLRAALAAVEPGAAVARALALAPSGGALLVEGVAVPLAPTARVVLVGAGKASPAMARACEAVLGDRLSAGLVLAKRGHVVSPPARIAVVEAGHPVPDGESLRGTRELVSLISGLGPEDLVLVVLSGGASSLLALPPEGIALEDLVALGELLLCSGAPIEEANAVRKHVSLVTGGRLARLASPARVVALVLSDVVGSAFDVIGSGPTAPDRSTFADALAVLSRRGLEASVPRSVARHLAEGARGLHPETPKPGDPDLARVRNVLVGSNELAVLAAAERARSFGLEPLVLTTTLEGEAREVGRVLGAILVEVAARGRPARRPACLLAGGETTVTLRGTEPGTGGRNQEVALSAAAVLDGLEGVLLVALATDGNDGPTDAAGAMVDGATLALGRAAGLDVHDHLARHDSTPFLAATGDLLLLGPTGTNVQDVFLLLAP